ncbi:hypothetical protein [Butyricimonas sp. Marseille-P3923]|uniref:hypothetical protein n=1 Tax=Butyricimonas sp. Marseille-P3923 TaxID=1987504 RepID=UPI000C078EEB|nr:hypothetical protein [Butyricimonas sp. Marseille-P3923]
MKLNKYLLIAVASLGLFACNNDKEEATPSGLKAISLNIVNPELSRAEQTPTTGEHGGTLAITPSHIFVKLLGTEPVMSATFTSLEEANTYTFFDVPTSCTGVEVIINNYSAYNSTATAETAKETNVTCYGSSTTLTPDGVATKENGTLQYDLYKTTVTVKPIVARIEASGIKLMQTKNPSLSATTETSKYATLNFAGIFLNGYCENGTLANNIVTASNPQVIESDDAETVLTAAKALSMGDFLETPATIFDATFPTTEKCYAYNFFVNADNNKPIITLAFTDATLKAGSCSPIRFAVVSKYNGKENFKFEAGKLYRITKLEVTDENITGDITGNTSIAVNATIVVEPWVIQDVTVEWK